VKRTAMFLSLVVLAATSSLMGQSSPSATSNPPAKKAAKRTEAQMKPFSAYAFGGGISLMGVNLQVATNIDRHLNLRGTGNFFDYTVNNIKINGSDGTNGINVNGNVNFATGGVSMDYYPFPKHGLRLSPGVLFYNQNQISASASNILAGTSFTLNGNKYYSEAGNPLGITASLGLDTRQQAFTLTTGWGNMIPRKGGHWSFPFELGAAFTGVPTINMGLTGGVCTTTPTTGCGSVTPGSGAVATKINTDLNAQINKYTNDLNALQVYPIFSFGVTYAFHGK